MDDEEWREIADFMPPQVGKRHVDWRNICDALIVRFNFRNCAWSKLPNASQVRMAFMRAIEAGVWARIGAALPMLKNVRQQMWGNVLRGAEIAAIGRRERSK